MTFFLKSINKVILLLGIVLLFGCAPKSQKFPLKAKSYLQKSEQSKGIKKQQYQIKAVEQLLVSGHLGDAQQLLNTLNHVSLDPSIDQQKWLLFAQLALKKNHPKLAIWRLRKIYNVKSLTYNLQIAYYAIAIESYERNNDPVNTIIARIKLSHLADKNSGVVSFESSNKNALSKSINLKDQYFVIWQNLQDLSLNTLYELSKKYPSRLLQGWFKLAVLAKINANNTKALVSSILNWKEKYPNHPANNVIPALSFLMNVMNAQPPKKLALFLPLHGKFAHLGQAVRDGFMTAFYDQTPASSTNIKVYDTSQQNVCDLYEKAIQQGSQFIVGPLTKTNVQKLMLCAQKNIPILALNYIEENQKMVTSAPIIQFGLSPTQAAQQAAQQAWHFNVSRIFIIVPKGSWGDKVENSFKKTWLKLGGKITNIYRFSAQDSLRKGIANALNIDQSKARTKALRKILGEKFKSALRRRKDINGIFLACSPQQARKIRPYLNFYYVGNIPIFSIPNIYRGFHTPRKDSDLNGVYFNDMPWLLIKNAYINKLRRQIRSLWVKNFKMNNRMYGLGVDTYILSAMFHRLLILPDFAIKGVTGQLYLNAQKQIYRRLVWAKFSHGIPKNVLLPTNSW